MDFEVKDQEGRTVETISDIQEFLCMMPLMAMGLNSTSLMRHRVKGHFDQWLIDLGEKDFAKYMALFRKAPSGVYANAAEAVHDALNETRRDFSSVVGYDAEKRLLMERVVYPEKMAHLGKKYCRPQGGGVLLYGPPGCGKTHIASALAGETDWLFIRRHMESVIEGFGETFQVVGAINRAVLFLDEIELFTMKRDENGSSERGGTNMFITEFDQLREKSCALIVGATNAPWLVDPAIIRSGRLDDLMYVGAPDMETRVGLFQHYSSGLPLAKNVDLEKLASKCAFYSCSDIAAVCKEASAAPWREALEGKEERDVMQADYERAIRAIPSTARPWFELASTIVAPDSTKARFRPMFRQIDEFRRLR